MFNTPSLLCQGAGEALRSADKPHLDPFLARHPGLPGRFSRELICDGLPLKLSTSEGWHNGVSNTPEGLGAEVVGVCVWGRQEGGREGGGGGGGQEVPSKQRLQEGPECICLPSLRSLYAIFPAASSLSLPLPTSRTSVRTLSTLRLSPLRQRAHAHTLWSA